MYDLGLSDTDRVASQLGGGLPEGTLCLMEGVDGAGKSVLSQRFVKGLCEEGYDVTYVSPEYDSSSFIDQMLSLSYDVRDHLFTTKRLLFLHADVDVQERLRSDDDEARDLILDIISDEGAKMWDSDVVIIDSLDLLLNNDPRFQELRESGEAGVAIQNFLAVIREKALDGTTVVLTVNHSVIDDEILEPIRNQSGVYITIQLEQAVGELRRQAVVNRFSRSGDDVDDVISFRVQAGLGLTIETRTVT